MKKFKFNLEKLLSYKNQILEREMQLLAEKTEKVHSLETEIEKLKFKKHTGEREFEENLKANITPGECQVYRNYLDRLKDSIEEETINLQLAVVEMEKQQDVVAEAKKESRSLEILKENKLDEYVKETRKAEERDIEEFVSAAGAIDALQ